MTAAYDNALAESTIGPNKTECVQAGTPFHNGLASLGDVELATAEWVHWYNTARLMHRLGRDHPLKPKPSTTLNTQPTNRSHTYETCASNPGCFSRKWVVCDHNCHNDQPSALEDPRDQGRTKAVRQSGAPGSCWSGQRLRGESRPR